MTMSSCSGFNATGSGKPVGAADVGSKPLGERFSALPVVFVRRFLTTTLPLAGFNTQVVACGLPTLDTSWIFCAMVLGFSIGLVFSRFFALLVGMSHLKLTLLLALLRLLPLRVEWARGVPSSIRGLATISG